MIVWHSPPYTTDVIDGGRWLSASISVGARVDDWLSSPRNLLLLDSEGSTLKHNYVKTNERRPILSATKM